MASDDELFNEFSQRRHVRSESFSNHGSVIIKIGQDISLRGRIKDFSTGGCLVELIDPFPEMVYPVDADVYLTSQDFSKLSRIYYKGRILRITPKGVGVQFM
ncbi:MAG: PilZ domain-containing protein [Magnetococcales bacterium]|nr:PilZ domain-containing protein [Magnetococcales bacterium]